MIERDLYRWARDLGRSFTAEEVRLQLFEQAHAALFRMRVKGIFVSTGPRYHRVYTLRPGAAEPEPYRKRNGGRPRDDEGRTQAQIISQWALAQSVVMAEPFRAIDVSRGLGITRDAAGQALRRLVKRRFLIALGKGPKCKYAVKFNANPPADKRGKTTLKKATVERPPYRTELERCLGWGCERRT